MTFQSAVRYDFAFGMPGELLKDGPTRVQPGFIQSASAAYNVVGSTAFTQAASGGIVQAGGTGNFVGILANPKVYASYGTLSGGPLAPTIVLPNNISAEFALMGYLVAILANANISIGDLVQFDNTTGALSSVAPVAVFTGVQALAVLTVSAISAGSLGVGSVVKNAAGAIIGTVESLGTGTGGNGTYNLDTSATVASGPLTASTVAAVGATLVPKTVVDEFPQPTAGGLVLLRMTN